MCFCHIKHHHHVAAFCHHFFPFHAPHLHQNFVAPIFATWVSWTTWFTKKVIHTKMVPLQYNMFKFSNCPSLYDHVLDRVTTSNSSIIFFWNKKASPCTFIAKLHSILATKSSISFVCTLKKVALLCPFDIKVHLLSWVSKATGPMAFNAVQEMPLQFQISNLITLRHTAGDTQKMYAICST